MLSCRVLSRALGRNRSAPLRQLYSTAAGGQPARIFTGATPLTQRDAWQVVESEPQTRIQTGPFKNLLIHHAERSEPIYLALPWLRDACCCPQCVDPHSGQKNFGTAQITRQLDITEVTKTESGALRVTWKNDHLDLGTHVSEYPAETVQGWVENFHKSKISSSSSEGRPELWDAKLLAAREPFYSHEGFMAGGDEFLTALDTLRLYGLFFLRGVPRSETAVEDIATKLGIIQETFYGRTWNVRSKPKAENVAYTSSFLGLHQDLLYMRSVPKLQLLHCLDNDTEGGEALFSDGGRAAQQIRHLYPKKSAILQRNRTVFRYDRDGHEYEAAWSPISESDRTISWSPPFQRPEAGFNKRLGGAVEYGRWFSATKTLQKLIESPEYVFEYRYQPGDCVVFDNVRLLHGRRQFDSTSGARWLKGTYVGKDSYLSTLYRAARERKPEEPTTAPADAIEGYATQWVTARSVAEPRSKARSKAIATPGQSETKYRKVTVGGPDPPVTSTKVW